MSENFHPFWLESAKDAFEGDGDFLLPVCGGEPDLMMGEDMAIIVLTTVGDQRVGLAIGIQWQSDLHEITRDAMRLTRAEDRSSVQ
ncbi:hypothetical protein ACSD7O_24185 [Methylorubrum extorquens]|uniref:hypothetical protein n=1 Tax=Methylorubrum extorquens TaxID=408 RepID=UPI003F601A27